MDGSVEFPLYVQNIRLLSVFLKQWFFFYFVFFKCYLHLSNGKLKKSSPWTPLKSTGADDIEQSLIIREKNNGKHRWNMMNIGEKIEDLGFGLRSVFKST